MSSMGLAELDHAVQAHEGIEQLKVNLKQEHDLKVDYMTAVWINVCSSHAPLHTSTESTALHEKIPLYNLQCAAIIFQGAACAGIACMYSTPQYVRIVMHLLPWVQLAVLLMRQAAAPECAPMLRMRRC